MRLPCRPGAMIYGHLALPFCAILCHFVRARAVRGLVAGCSITVRLWVDKGSGSVRGLPAHRTAAPRRGCLSRGPSMGFLDRLSR